MKLTVTDKQAKQWLTNVLKGAYVHVRACPSNNQKVTEQVLDDLALAIVTLKEMK